MLERWFLIVLCLTGSGWLDATAGVSARLFRHPDVSQSQIAFVYAGDIWLVPKSGGLAHRLSTPPGEESFPRFSPDGQWLAYTAAYDGNSDVYVVSTSGGIPTRLTHHPHPDRMLDWHPDGSSILFASPRESGKQRFNQLYRVGREGGLPTKLPLPYGEFAALAADGRTLAYMPLTRDFRTWKRYRGGMAPDIWLFDLESHRARNLTNSRANDTQPMWHGTSLYFASDRDAAMRYNLWALDTEGGAPRQVTHFTEHDIHFPAIGPQEIVFENGGRLYLLDLTTEKLREVPIEVLTDQATLKPTTRNVAKLIQDADLSPQGKRAVVQARGELFTLPAEHGFSLNLTRSSGVAERFPAWSPDGKELAYWSDRSGEYELTLRSLEPVADERQLTRLGPGFRYRPTWSPDGRKLAFIDQAMRIRIFDRDADRVVDVDQALHFFEGALDGFRVSWSADSRWMAYHRDLDLGRSAVFVWDTQEQKRHQLTSGFYNESLPTFDREGKYLYLTTARNWEPVYADRDHTWAYANATQLAAIPLRRDVASPLASRNDDDSKEDPEKDDAEDTKKKKKDDDEKAPPKPEPVKIDLVDFERRLVVLPPKAGNYSDLHGLEGKLLFRRQPRAGSADEKSPVLYWDFKERKEVTVVESAEGLRVSADGKKLLVALQGELFTVNIEENQKLEKKLATADLEVALDPKAEWRQLFTEVWRLERDYFYDPNLHGVDWNEMRRRYGALIEDAVTRDDVNFVIGELIAELNASHAYRGGGDTESAPERGTGLLGCDFRLERGAYRIARIIDGAEWDSEVRSPLREPGIGVNEGDWVLAVNGVPLDPAKDPWAAFQGLAGKTVLLTVNDRPTSEGARNVVVTTLDDESRLRNLAWIEEKRRHVERVSGGRVGYIYVPDTGVNGQTELYRMFLPQRAKDALIVDERFNDGGQIPDRFVELLNRPVQNYWGVRDGADWTWPPFTHVGPKVMLINQWSGSGGDCFPYYFKAAGLGPLIGMRTWGGLIGISGAPALIDGGVATVPTFGFYNLKGEWEVEGHGVEPDIEVVDDPSLMVNGGDPQLDRAIAEALRLLERNPPTRPAKPVYPIRSGR